MPTDAGALAGLLDRGGAPGEAQREQLLAALGPGAQSALHGPLAVAWTGGPQAAAVSGERVCVVGGRMYEPTGPPARETLTRWDGDAEPPAALRGDFGLLLWDGARGEGLLAADQMGQRALFWHDDGTRLRFASEICQLLRLLPRTPGPEPRTVVHWITVSGLPRDLTLYEGVHRIGAAQRLRIGMRRRPELKRWWPGRAQTLLDVDAPQAAALLRERLVVAVARRSAGSERTGVLLSGGLDSSTVAGVAATLPAGRAPARAYSAVFPDHKSVDEADLIAALTGSLDLKATRAVVRSGSVLRGALPYIERWQVPPVSPNLFFWAPLLERASADGVEVLLDGEGGDEIFGLSPYLVADKLLRGRVQEALDLGRGIPGAPEALTRRQARRWLWRFGVTSLLPAGAHTASRALRGPRRHVPAWVRPELARAYVSVVDGAAWKRFSGPRWRRWLLWATSSGLGPALLYDHVRHRGSMAGLEPRHPLPDVDVVELMLRLPPELSFDARHSRPLLRAAVAGLIPDRVRLRPAKSTFDEIFHASLAGPDLAVARHFLGPGARVGDYVDLERLHEILLAGDPPTERLGRRDWAVHVWRLLTGECWLRSLEDPAAPRREAERLGLPEADCRLEPAVAAG